MNVWDKPSFEELAMNAEIGAYQPEFGDDERADEPLSQFEPAPSAATATASRD